MFLGRAVNSTLPCQISAIASKSATPTKETMRQKHQILDYIVTQENAVITYTISNMKLAVHINASYLRELKARKRAGRHFFLPNETTIPQKNGAILNIAHIIKHVLTSATESKLTALHIMALKAVYARIILEETWHKHPPTPLKIDNAIADVVCNGKMQPKNKKKDMQFH